VDKNKEENLLVVSGSSSSGNSSSEESSGSSSDSKKNNYQYQMIENSILVGNTEPNWEDLIYDIEQIYSNWSIVTLDLYKQNINNQKILSFNVDLDDAAKAIKDKNKEQSLILLAKLYSYIPAYFEDFSDDQMQTNLYKVKSNLFNAYSIIGQNNPNEVKNYLQASEEAMVSMMNNIQNQKTYNLNKAYILLKDLQTTVDKNDVNIFYLKYKNLSEELNSL